MIVETMVMSRIHTTRSRALRLGLAGLVALLLSPVTEVHADEALRVVPQVGASGDFTGVLALSPDERWYAVVSQLGIVVVDVEQRQIVWRFTTDHGLFRGAAFTADSEHLVVLESESLVRFSLATGEAVERHEMRKEIGNVAGSAHFLERLPDGTFAAALADELVHWTPGSEPIIHHANTDSEYFHYAALSPRGHALRTRIRQPRGEKPSSELVDIYTGEVLSDRYVENLHFSPDGRFALEIDYEPAEYGGVELNGLVLRSVPDLRKIRRLSRGKETTSSFAWSSTQLAVIRSKPPKGGSFGDDETDFIDIVSLETGKVTTRYESQGGNTYVSLGTEPDVAFVAQSRWDESSTSGYGTFWLEKHTPSRHGEDALIVPGKHELAPRVKHLSDGRMFLSFGGLALQLLDSSGDVLMDVPKPVQPRWVGWLDDHNLLTTFPFRAPCEIAQRTWDLDRMIRLEPVSQCGKNLSKSIVAVPKLPPSITWIEASSTSFFGGRLRKADNEHTDDAMQWWPESATEPAWGRAWREEGSAVQALSLSRDQSRLAAVYRSRTVVIDTNDGSVVLETDYRGNPLLSADGSRFVLQNKNWTRAWDLAGAEPEELIHLEREGWLAKEAQLSADGRRLAVVGSETLIEVIDLDTRERVWLADFGDDWLIMAEDGTFAASPHGDERLLVGKENRLTTLAQHALGANRPDILMDSLGSPHLELRDHFRALAERRLERFRETLADAGLEALNRDTLELGSHTAPTADLDRLEVSGRRATLEATLRPGSAPIALSRVFVNSVPIHRGFGDAVDGGNLEQELKLRPGRNVVEVSAIDTAGVESWRARRVVSLPDEDDALGDIYLVSFAISDYQDDRLDLEYARKDGEDLVKLMASLESSDRKVHTLLLADEAVTSDAIIDAKGLLEASAVDDLVIVHIAGHGLFSEGDDPTYYFLTHDTDLDDLPGTAVEFVLLEDLMAGIGARRKLFLMDTCESGDLPIGSTAELETLMLADASARGFRVDGELTLVHPQEDVGSETAKRTWLHQERTRYIYNDVVERTGAVVLSSSRGGQFSYESDEVANGFFTEAVLRALTVDARAADADSSADIDDRELRAHVASVVLQLSQGQQQPVVDRDNLQQRIALPIAPIDLAELDGLPLPSNASVPPRTTRVPERKASVVAATANAAPEVTEPSEQPLAQLPAGPRPARANACGCRLQQSTPSPLVPGLVSLLLCFLVAGRHRRACLSSSPDR